jgi:hypothetical protein
MCHNSQCAGLPVGVLALAPFFTRYLVKQRQPLSVWFLTRL